MDKTKDQEDFEKFCIELDLDYDFESIGGYYRNWRTKQAFAIYKYSDKYSNYKNNKREGQEHEG